MSRISSPPCAHEGLIELQGGGNELETVEVRSWCHTRGGPWESDDEITALRPDSWYDHTIHTHIVHALSLTGKMLLSCHLIFQGTGGT